MLFEDKTNNKKGSNRILPIACTVEPADESLSASAADSGRPGMAELTHQNFYRGQVTEDRLRHESAAHQGGLARWKVHTNNQRKYDDQLLHAGMGQPTRPKMQVMAEKVAFGHANDNPGMGLEKENLQCFITGSYQIVPLPHAEAASQQHNSIETYGEQQGQSYDQSQNVPQNVPQNDSNEPSQNSQYCEQHTCEQLDQPQVTQSVTRSDIPQLAVAAVNEIAMYRRKKSVTFTNMLGRAQSSVGP